MVSTDAKERVIKERIIKGRFIQLRGRACMEVSRQAL